MVYVGLISYPLYLWHWPLLSFLRIVDLESAAADRLLRIAAVFVALVAAVLTYHLVERPLRRRGDLRKLGLRLLLMLAAVAVAGAGIHYADGFPRQGPVPLRPVRVGRLVARRPALPRAICRPARSR